MSGEPALEPLGHRIADRIAAIAASSPTQLALIAVYALWFVLGWSISLLSVLVSIIALTVTQMVLKRQLARESDDRRRDVALHAKLDELIIAKQGARDEMAGIETLDEEEIHQLRDNAQGQVETIDEEIAGRGNE